VLVPAVLAVTVTAVDHEALSVLVWMVKARVLNVADSPPAWACFTVKLVRLKEEPKSTCRKRLAAVVQNLSVLPPLTLPLTALAGPSLVLHAALPVAGRFNARLLAPELEDELDDEELELLEDELLLDDEELDEELLELDELEDEELLVVPSHTPKLVYQPQLGQ
jgi:hypothetical protein